MKRSGEKDERESKKKRELWSNSSTGVIESIKLQNFMCHDNLDFSLGPHMNFIIGQNGSGKSAILNALIVALGGRSAVTGRSTNMRDFIKYGKQKAKIEITFRNGGVFPYHPEEYGKKIIVVREFTANGSSTYKLKAQDGRVVSTHKSDLMNILQSLDIQVENPVSILTQEKSKKFLLCKTAKEENLYNFFYEGTGLKLLKEKYEESQKRQFETAKMLERKKQAFPAMQKELEQWRRYLDSSAKIAEYRNELQWANVILIEKTLKNKEKEYEQLESALLEEKKDLEKCQALIEKKRKDMTVCKDRQSKLGQSIKERTNICQQKQEQGDDLSSQLRGVTINLANLRPKENKLRTDITSLENNITEQKRRNQNDILQARAKRQSDIASLKADNESKLDICNQLDEKKNNKLEEQQSLQKHVDNLRTEIVSYEAKERKIVSRIAQAKQAIQNRINRFGDKSSNVWNDINRKRNSFSKLPVGPIGHHLQVTDPKWCVAVEASITPKLLRSFCVNNHQDSKLLMNILKQHYQNAPSVIRSPFENTLYDVSRKKAAFPTTVLDVLEFDNVVAGNCLIDQAGIENVILMEDRDKAQDLMMSCPPRNCYSAYVPNGDQLCSNPYRYYSSTKDPNQRSMLEPLHDSDIKSYEQERLTVKKEMNLRHSQVTDCLKLIEKAKAEYREASQQRVNLRNNIRDNEDRIADLQSFEEPRDVLCLEEELQQLKDEYSTNRIKLLECTESEATLKGRLEEIEKEKGTLKADVKKERDRHHQLAEAIFKITHDEEKLNSAIKNHGKSLTEKKKSCDAVKKEVEKLKVTVLQVQQEAEQTCSRIETKRSTGEIRLLLEQTEKAVERQSRCNKEDISNKYNEKYQVYVKAKKTLAKMEANLDRLNKMLEYRRSKFDLIRDMTQIDMNKLFMCILKGNKYNGQLDFNNSNKTLKILVAPRSTMAKLSNHNILSGGERSYVTVAFLLSMWQNIKMPFRILDEYDVFMDANNRQLTIDLIIEKVKEMGEHQFMFLSPLDLPAMPPSDFIEIHRMAPPERSKR